MAVPVNQTQVQGQGAVTADFLNSLAQTCTTAAQLRTFVGLPNMVVVLQGITTVNDGNAGIFYWNPLGNTPDDNQNFIVPSAAGPTGEWVRLTSPSGSLVLAGAVNGPLGANTLAAAIVAAVNIVAGAVGTTQLANGSVTTAKLAPNAVGTTQIALNAITLALLQQFPPNTFLGNNTGATANGLFLTIAQMQAALGIGALANITKFTSPTHTPVSAGLTFSDAHGLGNLPSVFIVQGYLKCLTAELGYAQNDVVIIDTVNGFGGSNGYGSSTWINNGNVGMAISNAMGISVANKSSGVLGNITAANWAAYTSVVYFQ